MTHQKCIAEARRRKIRTNGRIRFELENDPNSARRTMAFTGGSINRMRIFDSPPVGISFVEKT